MNLGNGLIYTEVLSNRQKKLKIGNLVLEVKDVICPVFIGNKLILKRIFDIGKKNKLIFSFNRYKILFDKLNISGFLKIFDIYKRISFDESKVIYTLPNYSVKNISELNEILNDFGIDFLKFSDYLGKDLVVDFNKYTIDYNNEKYNIDFYISFLIAGFLFYGDFVIKEDKFISFKIFWPIVNLNVKEFLDKILYVLAKNNFFVYPYLVNNNKIYQWNIEDWELIDNLLSIFNLDYINYQKIKLDSMIKLFCEKFNCDYLKNKFIWKILEYK